MSDRTTSDYVPPGAEHRRMREDFDSSDFNRHGGLSLGEFFRFMSGADEDMTAEECQIAFDEMDVNRDGIVDFEEFVTWWNERA